MSFRLRIDWRHHVCRPLFSACTINNTTRWLTVLFQYCWVLTPIYYFFHIFLTAISIKLIVNSPRTILAWYFPDIDTHTVTKLCSKIWFVKRIRGKFVTAHHLACAVSSKVSDKTHLQRYVRLLFKLNQTGKYCKLIDTGCNSSEAMNFTTVFINCLKPAKTYIHQ